MLAGLVPSGSALVEFADCSCRDYSPCRFLGVTVSEECWYEPDLIEVAAAEKHLVGESLTEEHRHRPPLVFVESALHGVEELLM